MGEKQERKGRIALTNEQAEAVYATLSENEQSFITEHVERTSLTRADCVEMVLEGRRDEAQMLPKIRAIETVIATLGGKPAPDISPEEVCTRAGVPLDHNMLLFAHWLLNPQDVGHATLH